MKTISNLTVLFVIILNITALGFILRNFVYLKDTKGKESQYSDVARMFSGIINFTITFGVFILETYGWELLLSPLMGLNYTGYTEPITEETVVYTPEVIVGVIMLESAIYLPYAINYLLYKVWYKKAGISKWWILPGLVVSTFSFMSSVCVVIFNNVADFWATYPWVWDWVGI